MTDAQYSIADDRGVLAVDGVDARTFLQGLVSADVLAATTEQAKWAALLTPQGKFLFDMMMVGADDGLLLDCERERRTVLLRKLSMFRLRSDVALTDRSDDLAVALVWGADALKALELPDQPGAARPWQDGVAFVDPRLTAAGARVIAAPDALADGLAAAGLTAGDRDAWEGLRISLGVPDGSRDMETEKAILLENGFDELGGIAWDKGCWMGQELTARTKYRGLVKKRLIPAHVNGTQPATGTPVEREGRVVGEVRSGVGGTVLALVRLDALTTEDEASQPLTAGDAQLQPIWPDWLSRPSPAKAS